MKQLLFLFTLLVAGAGWAQDATVLSPLDVARLETVASAAISDDGRRIAYYRVVPKDPLQENAPADLHLYVYDVESGESRPYVTSYSVANLAFRPQHQSLTFTARREGDEGTTLYEIPLDGGGARRLYATTGSISGYDWHPSGERLAFVASRPAAEPESTLPYAPEIYEENLSQSAGYVVDLTPGGEAREIGLEGHVTHLTWSPAGNRLAVAAAPSSLVDDFYTSQRIYLVDPQSLRVTATVDHRAKLGVLRWSPSGNRLAFIGGANENDPIEGRLLLVDATGGEPRNLLPDFAGSFDDLAWKSDNSLYVLASEGVTTSFGTVTTDGQLNRTLDRQATAFTQFDVADNGAIALVGSTAQHPNELYLLPAAGGEARRLTTSNPWLQNEKLGRQEVVRYEAGDGREIEGILIHPVAAPEGSLPLITVVHGGPEAHYDNGWLTGYSSPGQLAAGRGYAVFYPNYRGSTGRGLEFAMSSQGDPGGKEFDDIIDGIDYLIENYNIDRSRVGVTGGSYGGYATGWMATRHTDRFAAGVMFVGISNNLSKWGTSDIPEEMFLVHSRKRIWDDYAFFLERSPIYFAGQAKTPLLILAGKEDTRVDPGQSYELYRHIKTRTDTPVRLVLYPGEGHGNRRATARYDYSLRMMRWFDEFLLDDDREMPAAGLEVEK